MRWTARALRATDDNIPPVFDDPKASWPSA